LTTPVHLHGGFRFACGERLPTLVSLVQWVPGCVSALAGACNGTQRFDEKFDEGFNDSLIASVSIFRRTGLTVLATGFALSCAVWNSGFAFGQAAAAGKPQSGASPTSGTGPGTQTHPAKRAHPHSKAAKAAVEPAPVETRPPDPPPPDWPVKDKAKPASVAWNGRDLSIAAKNSTLEQILHDVSTATGLKVEGLSSSHGSKDDQRIYGSYGPASERDVLSQLLQGSGYNVIMVGDQGEGTPRELVLTAQAAGSKNGDASQAMQSNQASEEDAPEEPEAPEPPPEQPFHPPVNNQPVNNQPVNGQPGQQPPVGRTPQQMLQEMQQRQQQLQQQQQQGSQPNN
jgi:hypothetical protein